MKLPSLLLILLLSSSTLWGQAAKVTVRGDTRVNDMVALHVELSSRTGTVAGWRIQIASLSGAGSKDAAFDLRPRFMAEHPEVQAYIVYDEPNFKVKVGDFRSRLEAYAFLQQIKDAYKGHIVRDNIYPEPPILEELIPDEEESGDE